MSKLDSLSSRPPTLSFTSRVDARYLATLLGMWQEKGSTPRSISELVRLSLESFAEILVTSNQATFVETQEEAQHLLGTLGLLPQSVLKRNLLKAMVKEGNFDSLNASPTVTKNPSRKGRPSTPEMDLALHKLESAMSEESITSYVEDDAKRTQDLLSALNLFPDDVPPEKE